MPTIREVALERPLHALLSRLLVAFTIEFDDAFERRMLDAVAQTRAFVDDPAGSLPHYPLWDMNRGFGP